MADGKFPGVEAGSEKEKKIERCSRRLKAEGKTKSQAIAICRASIEKKERDMAKKRKGKTARQRRRERRREEELLKDEALELTDEPMADIEAEEVLGKDFLDEETEDFLKTFYAESNEDIATVYTLDELEILKVTQEMDEKVEKLHNDAVQVVENVVDSEELTPIDKAHKILELGIDVVEKTEELLVENKTEKVEFDAEAEEFAAFANQFGEKKSLLEQAKAVLSSGTRNALPDSAFAFVIEQDGKKIRKYPIHDKAHVRNALARASQMIQKGGEDGEDAKKALPKIKAAAKKLGIGQPSKEFDNALTITKDKNDDWRYVAWTSNNFKDRDGDILTERGHKEFIEFLNEKPGMAPLYMSWHTKGTQRERPVDSWMYKNGFMIYSGVLNDAEAKSLLRIMQKTKLGMSHGFIPLERDAQNPKLITKYRTFEISDLPLEKAANVFTDLEVIVKEVFSMDKANYLKDLLGEDKFSALVQDTELKQQLLQDAEVESKEVEEETVETKVETVEVPANLVEQLKKEFGLDELSQMLKEIIEQNTAKDEIIKTLTDEVSKKEADNADKLADMIAAPAPFVWQEKRASQSKDSKLDEADPEDAKLKASAPRLHGEHWLSNTFKVAPVPDEQAAS